MHPTHLRNLFVASTIALMPMLIVVQAQLWPDANWVVGNGSFVGVDFTNYWLGGRLAVEGQINVLYNLDAYNAHRFEIFSPSTHLFVFSYPPNILPLLVPFGLLPYGPALAVWSVAGIVAFAFAASNWDADRNRNWLSVLVIVSAPVLWNNIFHGQLALWLTVLFVVGLRLTPTHPVVGGILIGLLTIKPQLGILLPIILLSERRWIAILSATLTAIALASASVIWFGWDSWSLYLVNIVPVQESFLYELRDRYYGLLSVSAYGGLVHAGVSFASALVAHFIIAAAVVLTALRYLFDCNVSWPLKVAITATATVLVPPYMLAYDLAIPIAAITWYLTSRTLSPTRLEQLMMVSVWIIPFGFLMLFNLFHVSLGALPLMASFAWLCRQGQMQSGRTLIDGLPTFRLVATKP